MRLRNIAPYMSSRSFDSHTGRTVWTPNYRATFVVMGLLGLAAGAIAIAETVGFRPLENKEHDFYKAMYPLRVAASVLFFLSMAAVSYGTGYGVRRKFADSSDAFGSDSRSGSSGGDDSGDSLGADDDARFGGGDDDDDLVANGDDDSDNGSVGSLGASVAGSVVHEESGRNMERRRPGATLQTPLLAAPTDDDDADGETTNRCLAVASRFKPSFPPGPHMTGLLTAVFSAAVAAAAVGSTIGFRNMWTAVMGWEVTHVVALGEVLALGASMFGGISVAAHGAKDRVWARCSGEAAGADDGDGAAAAASGGGGYGAL